MLRRECNSVVLLLPMCNCNTWKGFEPQLTCPQRVPTPCPPCAPLINWSPTGQLLSPRLRKVGSNCVYCKWLINVWIFINAHPVISSLVFLIWLFRGACQGWWCWPGLPKWWRVITWSLFFVLWYFLNVSVNITSFLFYHLVDKPVEIENADKIKNPGTSLLASSFNSANFIVSSQKDLQQKYHSNFSFSSCYHLDRCCHFDVPESLWAVSSQNLRELFWTLSHFLVLLHLTFINIGKVSSFSCWSQASRVSFSPTPRQFWCSVMNWLEVCGVPTVLVQVLLLWYWLMFSEMSIFIPQASF